MWPGALSFRWKCHFASRPERVMSATQIIWRVGLLCVLSIGASNGQAVPSTAQDSSRSCALSGTVTARETRSPVQAAFVALIGSETIRTLLSDSDGLFQFTGLTAGQYTVLVKKVGFL